MHIGVGSLVVTKNSRSSYIPYTNTYGSLYKKPIRKLNQQQAFRKFGPNINLKVEDKIVDDISRNFVGLNSLKREMNDKNFRSLSNKTEEHIKGMPDDIEITSGKQSCLKRSRVLSISPTIDESRFKRSRSLSTSPTIDAPRFKMKIHDDVFTQEPSMSTVPFEMFLTTKGTNVKTVGCGHKFDAYQLSLWFKRNFNCPSCRLDIQTIFEKKQDFIRDEFEKEQFLYGKQLQGIKDEVKSIESKRKDLWNNLLGSIYRNTTKNLKRKIHDYNRTLCDLNSKSSMLKDHKSKHLTNYTKRRLELFETKYNFLIKRKEIVEECKNSIFREVSIEKIKTDIIKTNSYQHLLRAMKDSKYKNSCKLRFNGSCVEKSKVEEEFFECSNIIYRDYKNDFLSKIYSNEIDLFCESIMQHKESLSVNYKDVKEYVLVNLSEKLDVEYNSDIVQLIINTMHLLIQ